MSISLILLWLSGVGLRITVLAIPPVIPLCRRVSEVGVHYLGAANFPLSVGDKTSYSEVALAFFLRLNSGHGA